MRTATASSIGGENSLAVAVRMAAARASPVRANSWLFVIQFIKLSPIRVRSLRRSLFAQATGRVHMGSVMLRRNLATAIKIEQDRGRDVYKRPKISLLREKSERSG